MPNATTAAERLALRHLQEHLYRCVTSLDASLTETFVWGTLAHLNILELVQPGGSLSSQPPPVASTELRPIPLGQLSDIVQLPKETTRNVLRRLATKGKTLRCESGGWVIDTRGIDPSTIAFTLETVQRLMDCASALQQTATPSGALSP